MVDCPRSSSRLTGVDTYSDRAMVPGVKSFSGIEVDEALAAEATPCRGVLIQAHPDNASRIWVGMGSAVKGRGICLNAGDPPVAMPVADLALVHALAELVGDKLLFQARG